MAQEHGIRPHSYEGLENEHEQQGHWFKGSSCSKLLGFFQFTSKPAANGAANGSDDAQQATIQGSNTQESTRVGPKQQDQLPISDLVKKVLRARDRLNLQFARHRINSSNQALLINVAESAMVIDELAQALAEKQGQVEQLTTAAETGASSYSDARQATIHGSNIQQFTRAGPEQQDQLPISDLVKKVLRARDRLNLQFARHRINSSNQALLINVAESAMVIDELAQALAEKQGPFK